MQAISIQDASFEFKERCGCGTSSICNIKSGMQRYGLLDGKESGVWRTVSAKCEFPFPECMD